MKRLFAALSLFVAACAGATPSPIAYGGSRAPERTGQPNEEAPRRDAQIDAAVAFDQSRLPRTHRVEADQSLYDIAALYRVPLLALIEQNGFEPPYALGEGDVVALPPPRVHVAQRGESLGDVAARFSVDERSLALLNRWPFPYQLREGERVYLPAVAAAQASLPLPRDEPSAAQASAGRFFWPLRGRVLARFGPQPNGQRFDGVVIAGREGEQIVAADDGEVVYAGADLASYGALVLVRHEGDYVTAYAYGRRALVREGDQVRAGQPIAELGQREGGARLLFQVRHGRSAVDPLPLLGAR
jgi:murein DD-endopeptidase MepM/ murein hydrolase activator NlpD